MKRICFVGASTVEGMGDEKGLGWPGRLHARAPADVVIYNLGVRGQTVEELQDRAAKECRARILGFDLGGIVFCSGVNDLGRIENGQFRTPAHRPAKALRKMIGELKDIAPVIGIGPFPVYEPKMPFFSASAGMTFNFQNADIANASNAYEAVCEELDIPYLQAHPVLMKNDAYINGLAGNDGLHPDGTGYQAVAELIGGWAPWQELIS
ncbi:MAG: hypothetical protein JKX93_14555 [Rhizobiaceae bacterium]|nr:hypothetical protein [Rhizobiaceae bacterium]